MLNYPLCFERGNSPCLYARSFYFLSMGAFCSCLPKQLGPKATLFKKIGIANIIKHKTKRVDAYLSFLDPVLLCVHWLPELICKYLQSKLVVIIFNQCLLVTLHYVQRQACAWANSSIYFKDKLVSYIRRRISTSNLKRRPVSPGAVSRIWPCTERRTRIDACTNSWMKLFGSLFVWLPARCRHKNLRLHWLTRCGEYIPVGPARHLRTQSKSALVSAQCCHTAV